MKKQETILSTIGYEGADINDFITTLLAAKITKLIDVRELAISRRRGFAKKALSSALTEAGITYIHLKGLGDPKLGREAARRKDYVSFRKIFASHMKTEIAQHDLQVARDIILGGAACLMCFERDPHTCHRSIVANIVCEDSATIIRNLGVREGLAKRTTR